MSHRACETPSPSDLEVRLVARWKAAENVICRPDGSIVNAYSGRSLTWRSKAGYRYTWHQIDGKRRSFVAHRLVWVWHRGRIPDGMTIDHIDGRHETDRDNAISNLRLLSRAENVRAAHEAGKYADKRKYAALDDAKVARIKAALAAGRKASSLARAAGVSPATVYAIRSGRRWGHVAPDPVLLAALEGA